MPIELEQGNMTGASNDATAITPSSTNAPNDFLQKASQEPAVINPDQGPVSQDAGEDQSRYQYWQSQYDKMRVKHGEVEDQLNRYNTYKPIVEYLSSNPDLVQKIDYEANRGNRKPEQPQKPYAFDPIEAVTNPASESFKYRQSLDDYRDLMGQYLDKRYSAIEEKTAQEEASRDKVAKQTHARGQVQEYLTKNHGMQDAEITDFMQTMGSEESLTPANLVKFYKFLKNEKSGTQPQQDFSRRRPEGLPPLGVISGQGSVNMSDDDIFGQSFLTKRRGL